MFANRFTAVIDACVLVSVAKRNLILSLADAELFRVGWTAELLSETEAALLKLFAKQGRDDDEAETRAKRAITNIQVAFPESVIEGYEDLAGRLNCLPDPDDHHVLAAAIHCKASVIVTDNLRHFPEDVLSLYEIEAKSPDDFIADTIDLDYRKSISAIRELRRRLKHPELTPSELLERWRAQGLEQTAEFLNPHLDKI